MEVRFNSWNVECEYRVWVFLQQNEEHFRNKIIEFNRVSKCHNSAFAN